MKIQHLGSLTRWPCVRPADWRANAKQLSKQSRPRAVYYLSVPDTRKKTAIFQGLDGKTFVGSVFFVQLLTCITALISRISQVLILVNHHLRVSPRTCKYPFFLCGAGTHYTMSIVLCYPHGVPTWPIPHIQVSVHSFSVVLNSLHHVRLLPESTFDFSFEIYTPQQPPLSSQRKRSLPVLVQSTNVAKDNRQS